MRRLVLIAVLAAACGGDDGGGPIPIDDLDSAAVNVFCNFYVSCGLIDDLSTCRSLNLDINIDPDLVAAVHAGKVMYDADKARECLNGVALSCNRVEFNRNDTNNNAACDETFKGTVAAGGQCAIDQECISQQCDVPGCSMACCQGTCTGDTPPVHPTVGQACGTGSALSCDNSYCDYTAMLCTAYKANGAACQSSTECGQGTCVNQVCTALVAEGGACSSTTSTTQCELIGDYCSGTTMTCTKYGLAGDACTTGAECSPIYQCTSGACALRPTLGETCSPNSSATDCIDKSYCDGATLKCTAPKPDGAACQSDGECVSNNCDATSNTCLTPPICI